jgi:hypothetical protein
MPLQGELINSFRFGSVLFFAAFTFGDFLAKYPKFFGAGVLVIYVWMNHLVTMQYGIGGWAY